jgi:hypothetical protein
MDAQDPNTVPAWHYNFRNRKVWPDLRVVRMHWHIALGIMTLAGLLGLGCLAVLWVYSQELAQNKQLRAQIEALEPSYQAQVQQHSEFVQKALVIQDVRNLYDPSFNPIDAILLTSQTLPSEMVLQTLSVNENQTLRPNEGLQREVYLVLEGFLEGSEEEGLKVLDRMRERMMQDTTMATPIASFRVINLRRQTTGPMSGALSFGIRIGWQARTPPSAPEATAQGTAAGHNKTPF